MCYLSSPNNCYLSPRSIHPWGERGFLGWALVGTVRWGGWMDEFGLVWEYGQKIGKRVLVWLRGAYE